GLARPTSHPAAPSAPASSSSRTANELLRRVRHLVRRTRNRFLRNARFALGRRNRHSGARFLFASAAITSSLGKKGRHWRNGLLVRRHPHGSSTRLELDGHPPVETGR